MSFVQEPEMREEELFGKIYAIVTYDVSSQRLRVSLKKLKVYSREYFQSGLYLRYNPSTYVERLRKE
jgi:hypothetical protein